MEIHYHPQFTSVLDRRQKLDTATSKDALIRDGAQTVSFLDSRTMLTSKDVRDHPVLAAAIAGLHTTTASDEFQPLFGPSLPNASCGICLESCLNGESLTLLQCGHYFHTECATYSLLKHSLLCPECRADLFDSCVAQDVKSERQHFETDNERILEPSAFDVLTPENRVAFWFDEAHQRFLIRSERRSGVAGLDSLRLAEAISVAWQQFLASDADRKRLIATRVVDAITSSTWFTRRGDLHAACCLIAATFDSPLPDPNLSRQALLCMAPGIVDSQRTEAEASSPPGIQSGPGNPETFWRRLAHAMAMAAHRVVAT